MKTFCIVPFTMLYSINNGDYTVCCHSELGLPKDSNPTQPANFNEDSIVDVWNNNYFQQLRLDLINGVKNKACATCWKMESNKEFSFRQKYTSPYSEEFCKNIIDDTIKNNGKMTNMPSLIQIKLGNTCNLKCIMCNQASSSLISEEVEDWKNEQVVIPKWLKWIDKWEINWKGVDDTSDLDTIYKNLSLGLLNTDQIQLIGGEPLVNPMTTLILKRLVEADAAKNIKIWFISNLTSLTDNIVELLSEFKHSVISVSWDHVNIEKFRFIRYPADYSHFKKNLDKLLSSKIESKVSITINIFNVYDIEEIFEEFEKVSKTMEGEYTINLQYVENPNYFSIRYLETEQKEKLNQEINDYLNRTTDHKIWRDNPSTYQQLRSISKTMKLTLNDFDEVVKERTRVLKIYDATRKTDYKSLFPFLKDY